MSPLLTGPAGDLSAHGLGGQQDLPISLGLAVAGAVAALVVSFTVLALAWRTPRHDPDHPRERPAPAWLQHVVTHRAFAVGLRVFGMAVFLYTVFVAIFGVDKVINPIFGIVFVWLWVGIVPMSLFFGPFWKAISPVRTINLVFAKVAGSDPDEGLYRYPERLGYWPAALGIYAFVWLELVYPFMSELSPVRLWCAVYVAVMLVGGAVFGNTFYENADPFEVYSTLVGKLSVWAVNDGVLLLRSPLANVDTVRVAPGLIGVVGVLFGSTGFDSFGESPTWVSFIQGTTISGYLLNNLALLFFCAAAAGLFALGSVLTGVGPGTRRRDLPNALAHSVIPIIVGYIFAHYLSYFVGVGSRTLILASDPLSNGANIFGTGTWNDVVWLSYHPTLLANLKVGGVVLGHVVAAVVAHDRALRLLPPRHHLTGQIPLLTAMVAFTSIGLLLLFSHTVMAAVLRLNVCNNNCLTWWLRSWFLCCSSSMSAKQFLRSALASSASRTAPAYFSPLSTAPQLSAWLLCCSSSATAPPDARTNANLNHCMKALCTRLDLHAPRMNFILSSGPPAFACRPSSTDASSAAPLCFALSRS